jgi:hypothetical protein
MPSRRSISSDKEYLQKAEKSQEKNQQANPKKKLEKPRSADAFRLKYPL